MHLWWFIPDPLTFCVKGKSENFVGCLSSIDFQKRKRKSCHLLKTFYWKQQVELQTFLNCPSIYFLLGTSSFSKYKCIQIEDCTVMICVGRFIIKTVVICNCLKRNSSTNTFNLQLIFSLCFRTRINEKCNLLSKYVISILIKLSIIFSSIFRISLVFIWVFRSCNH